ncbi:MAG: heme-binding domain-containing protein [bacterium]
MKKYALILSVILLGIGLISFTGKKDNKENLVYADENAMEIPENVQQVIDKSCYGCHNSESRSEKGKKKLQWDKLGEMKTYKLVGKLTDIADIIGEGEMPPKDFLSKKPEATPTAVEKKILSEWAESTARKLAQ